MLKRFSGFIAVLTIILLGFRNSPEIKRPDNNFKESSSCRTTSNGLAINWHAHDKLGYVDFKAKRKNSRGFAIATANSNFGYTIEEDEDVFEIDIYVQFYCKESWWNPRIKMDDVLEHEQLHFDICELYGRKFFKAVLELKKDGKFNAKSIEILYTRMEKEFDEYQDLYDGETDHSTNGEMQRKWNDYVHSELNRLNDYAGYWKF